jgi:hypothetical protein
MLGGDLSNRQAPILAFCIDELLFKEAPLTTTLQRLKYRMLSETQKFLTRPLNKDFITIIDNLWNKYSYSIYFITFHPFEEQLYKVLDDNNVNYTKLIYVDEWDDLRRACHLQYTYYFDRNGERLSFIGSTNALHIDELPHIIR